MRLIMKFLNWRARRRGDWMSRHLEAYRQENEALGHSCDYHQHSVIRRCGNGLLLSEYLVLSDFRNQQGRKNP